MCVNCMSQLDVMTYSSVGAAGVALGSAKQFFARLGLYRFETSAQKDARVAGFLATLGLDPAEHLDLVVARPDRAAGRGAGPGRDPLVGEPSAPAPEPVGRVDQHGGDAHHHRRRHGHGRQGRERVRV